MAHSGRLIKACTLLLLVVQLLLPLSGQAFLFGHWSDPPADRGASACTHDGAGNDHGEQHEQEQIPHCHELEAPGVTASGPIMLFMPVVARLAAFYRGTLLSGYGDPLDIPPQLPV